MEAKDLWFIQESILDSQRDTDKGGRAAATCEGPITCMPIIELPVLLTQTNALTTQQDSIRESA